MLLLSASDRIPARIMANSMRGVWSMSAADGQEPPHEPHWIHISRRETPAVCKLTSSKKRTFGLVSSGETTGWVLKGHLQKIVEYNKYKRAVEQCIRHLAELVTLQL